MIINMPSIGYGARRHGDVEAFREDHDHHRCGEFDITGNSLFALHRALDLRHLRQCLATPSAAPSSSKAAPDWFFPRKIPADYLFGQSIERDTGDVVRAAGDKDAGNARGRRSTPPDFSPFPAAGAGLQGEDHRSRQWRWRHLSTPSSRRQSSAPCWAARTWPGS